MAIAQQLVRLAETVNRLADAHPERAVDGFDVAVALSVDPNAASTFELFEEAQRSGLIDGYWAGGMTLPAGLVHSDRAYPR